MADGLAAMTMAVQAVEDLRNPARCGVGRGRPRFVRYKRRREYPGGRDPRTRVGCSTPWARAGLCNTKTRTATATAVTTQGTALFTAPRA